MSGLAPKADTKPVTPSQRRMSQLHLNRRARISKMPESPKKKKIAAYYDLTHSKQHLSSPSTGRDGKKLAKAVEKIMKKRGMTSLGSFLRKSNDG